MRYSFLLITLMLAMASCSKYKNYTKATVIDSKNGLSNGCGYLLQLEGGERKKPQNLPSAFSHDGMKVKYKGSETGTTSCATDSNTISVSVINIDDMTRDID